MACSPGGAAAAYDIAPDDEQACERTLIVRVQRGDLDAFDVLARRYARRAFAVAYRILQHAQDAEDVVQDAFIAALDGLASFDTTRPFAPWFLRIVANRALNAASARSTRERHVAVMRLWNDEAAAMDGDPAERSEIREYFRQALATLPRQQRLIVELSDVDGHSSTEIGEMLDLPRGTVRWHLHQARRTLRRALAAVFERATPRTA